jgi:hypothetical protein
MPNGLQLAVMISVLSALIGSYVRYRLDVAYEAFRNRPEKKYRRLTFASI